MQNDTVTMPGYSIAGIRVRWYAPTDRRNATMRAWRSDSSWTEASPETRVARTCIDNLDLFDNAVLIARELAQKLEWPGDWHACRDNHDGYMFVREVRSDRGVGRS